VSLACYDERGRLSAKLQSGERLPAGTHVRPFPAGALAAGRYLCRLGTEHGAAARVVTLAAR
jgi:hypothetical protein